MKPLISAKLSRILAKIRSSFGLTSALSISRENETTSGEGENALGTSFPMSTEEILALPRVERESVLDALAIASGGFVFSVKNEKS